MTPRFSSPWKEKGITLVELMIALVVSLIVMLGVATVYSSSKKSYKIQEEMGRLQENARFAFEELTRNIRQAGYYGANPTVKSFLQASANISMNIDAGIMGYEYTGSNTTPGNTYTITSLTNTGSVSDWTAVDGDDTDSNNDNLPAWLAGRVLVGNDIIRVIFASNEGGICAIDPSTFNASSASINLAGGCDLDQGSFAFVSDGEIANLFQNVSASNASTLSRGTATGAISPGNIAPSSEPWSVRCESERCRAMAGKQYAYYIGIGASGEPALFRADISNGFGSVNHDEIVEGVENMQVLFGIDTSPGDDNYQPTRYLSANDPNLNFDDVIAVRISLLLRTPQELNRPAVSNTYRLLGVDSATGVGITSPSDRRIRKVYTTTIFLRNKALYRRDFNAEL